MSKLGRGIGGVALTLWVVGCGSGSMFTAPGPDTDPDVAMAAFVAGGWLPAVAVAVIDGGATLYTKVTGVRKRGDPTPVTDDDAFQIGSDTKAMTALVAATVVDAGQLTWASTVGDVLGGTVTVGAAYRAVTLRQLLNHTSGLPEMPGETENAFDAATTATTDVTAQRRQIVTDFLGLAPLAAPDVAYSYSSGNYVVAGLMLEVATGQPWETLMKDRVFTPLAMTHAGFGLPATPGTIDAPWGHAPQPIAPSLHDIAPGFGPAGTVHASIGDLTRYVMVYLNGGLGPQGRIISEAALAEIKTPRLEHYGFGWLVGRLVTGAEVMVHSGSNGNFYCVIALFPERRGALIAMTNAGDMPEWARLTQVNDYLRAHFGLPAKAAWAD